MIQERFEEIYARNEWLYGSGEGSLLAHNLSYIAFLEGFLAEYQIKSVVDLGCGDWQFSEFVNWGDVSYRGYDVVSQIIAANDERFSDDDTKFILYSGEPSELPSADLLIAKDVLQHLSDARVAEVLRHLPRFRYALVTNSLDPHGETINRDTPDGGGRYLDITKPPFNIEAEIVFEFKKKQVSDDGTVSFDPDFRKTTHLIRP